MTEMPTDLFYERERTYIDLMTGNEQTIIDYPRAEMSCSLKLDFQIDPDNPEAGKNKRKAELANNNLHIWELAEVLRGLQEKKPGLNYRVLAPKEISELFIDSPAGARETLNPQVGHLDFANVIAAFNGPMAHMYLRGPQGWNTFPNREELLNLAKALRVLFQIYDPHEAQKALGIDPVDYLNLLENKVGRLEQSVDKILVRLDGEYFHLGVDGSLNMMSFDLEYVNASDRIQKLNHPQRSGDIILIMRDKLTEAIEKRYTVGAACKAWHGSLNRSDSFVPFIIAYPGGNKFELQSIIMGTDGCSLQGCDGNWRVTSMIKTITEKQYSSE